MNTVVELTAHETAAAAQDRTPARPVAPHLPLEDLGDPATPAVARRSTGLKELDRVLGGGLPAGAAIVLGGEPGIGKSTLLAQAAGNVARHAPALYATAEEALDQVRARLRRLGLGDVALKLAASNDADAIAGAIETGSYALVVVDSIQLMSRAGCDGEPGSVSQVKACAQALVEAVKRAAGSGRATTLVIVGHVTKEGGLAGPRLLEHLVDTVLAFEGDRYQDLRVLRALKNRYGSTNEIGLFRMGGDGLAEVPDASGLFLADRDASVSGSCVAPALEGNRCVLVEVQALVNATEYPQPVRRVSGLDPNRVAMVLAVLSRRLRYPLGTCDVFVNVTGGARILEPAADLAIAMAVASAWREQPVPADLCAIGEVGLGGELRPASRYDARAAEARRLGFQRLIGPGAGGGRGRVVATKLDQAIAAALGDAAASATR